MDKILTASEIVELGIQIEKNGRDFYNTVYARTKLKKVKDIFKYLAGEEIKHITKFKEILDAFHSYEPKEAYPDEYFSYMNSLADGFVFTKKNKGSEIAKATKDEKQAIAIGIKAEKDSIAFYDGMKKVMPASEGKIVEKIIKEEESHLKELTALK